MKNKNQKLELIKNEKNGWAAFAILWRVEMGAGVPHPARRDSAAFRRVARQVSISAS